MISSLGQTTLFRNFLGGFWFKLLHASKLIMAEFHDLVCVQFEIPEHGLANLRFPGSRRMGLSLFLGRFFAVSVNLRLRVRLIQVWSRRLALCRVFSVDHRETQGCWERGIDPFFVVGFSVCTLRNSWRVDSSRQKAKLMSSRL